MTDRLWLMVFALASAVCVHIGAYGVAVYAGLLVFRHAIEMICEAIKESRP